MTITADILLTELSKQSTQGPEAVKQIFTGLLAGVSMCLEDPNLCRRMEGAIRVDWALTGPAPDYSPAIMARRLLRMLRRADGGNGV